MKRIFMENLKQWLSSPSRRPMILRGARQTGKTWLIRQLAQETGRTLIELNFEKKSYHKEFFEPEEIPEILSLIEDGMNVKIDPSKTILFLDEVQAFPEIFGKLRWFYEDLPELPVIAAGSLLEFALEEYEGSMPVGRVTFRYLHPMSFIEFLWAMGEDPLASRLMDARKNVQLPNVLHRKCVSYFKQFCLIGGMPAVVKHWAESQDLEACQLIQEDILSSYQTDFHKYKKRLSAELLQATMTSAMNQLGSKFVYKSVSDQFTTPQIKLAFSLLEKAQIIASVVHSAGNGVPLGAEENRKFIKAESLDTGLVMVSRHLDNLKKKDLENLIWADRGGIAEQLAGQLIRSRHNNRKFQAYYWNSLSSGATAEIDYLLDKNGIVIPVEVKAGTSGSMKSLHQFMYLKGLKKAVRLDLNPPSSMHVHVKTTSGNEVDYELLSFPLYMAELILQEEI